MTGIAPSTSFAAPRGGSQTAVSSAPAAAVSGRDPRLDFYRGLAMFIILIAHIPYNAWAGWIPARFGFSDATEIFVFCSGMASAVAFGGAFLRRGWLMGTAAGTQWQEVPMLGLGLVAVGAGALRHANALDATLLGEERAQALGFRTGRIRLLIFLSTVLLTGLAVSVAGIAGQYTQSSAKARSSPSASREMLVSRMMPPIGAMTSASAHA